MKHIYSTAVILAIATGCSTAPVEPSAPDHSAATTTEASDRTATSANASQVLWRNGSKFCDITTDGEVWINGGKEGRITSSGEIWVAGSKEGSIEQDGSVWKEGNRVGEITSDQEVWINGEKVGQVETDGTVWCNGERVGSTTNGTARRAIVVFFFGFFQADE